MGNPQVENLTQEGADVVQSLWRAAQAWRAYPGGIVSLHKLFETVREYVLESGGDGWGMVVTRQPQAMADAFEAYEKEHDGWFLGRMTESGDISFYNGQEVITFCDTVPADLVGYEIVVQVPFAMGPN